MAITWANILEWQTGPLDEIAQTLFEASQGLRDAYEKGQDHLNALQSEGDAVTAMRATTITNLASLERALTNVNGALMAIEGARDGVGDVLAQANDVLAEAATKQFEIDAGGSVQPMASAPKSDLILIDASALATRVKEILKYADQVDTDLYHALQDINNDRYTDGDRANNQVIGVPDFPQPNWTPSQVAAWWKSLPDDRKQFFTDHNPDAVRHLDGLPAAARDRANRFALDGYFDEKGEYHKGALDTAEQVYNEANAKYQAALKKSTHKELNPALAKNDYIDPEVAEAKRELDRAKTAYEDLKVIKSQTDNVSRLTRGLAPAYLLDFNYDEKYHRTTAIVSAGNPDTATRVSTVVPGIGTNVRGDLGYYMEFNDRLRDQTKHAGINPNTVATISYLGYVAPKNDAGHIYQAADISYADRAAPKLARFEEGLRANAAANNHYFLNTLLGHSYGSTTSGKSMTLVAPGTVDRFIMCGSPGSGVQSIDAYNIPKEHVYESSIREGDAVQGLGPDASYGTNPRKLEGITHLSGDASQSEEYWHTYDSITKNPFDPVGSASDYFAHSFANHMAYFHEGTRTSQDFANIVAGGKQTTDEEWAAIKAARGK